MGMMPWLGRMDDATARRYECRHGSDVWMTPWFERVYDPWLGRMDDATARRYECLHGSDVLMTPWFERMYDPWQGRMTPRLGGMDVATAWRYG